MKAWFVPFTVALALLGGCMGPEAGPQGAIASGTGAGAAETTAAAPAPSADLGSIDVTAVTDELEPVPGAQIVIIDADLTAFTDAAGKATFNDLEPGEYTLAASKPAYSTSQEKGIIARVAANEVVEIRFVLDPIAVVTAESSFHRVIPIKGFVACSVYVAPVGNLDQCGKGLFVNGQTYGADPNENTLHTYPVEAPQIQQIFSEVVWKPTNEALSNKMRVWNYPSRQPCAGQASVGYCYNSPFGGKGGISPVQWSVLEGQDENITKSLAGEAKTLGKETPFPRTFGLFLEPVVTKPVESPLGYAVTYQQSYNVYMSVFYGEPAPAGYSALPPS